MDHLLMIASKAFWRVATWTLVGSLVSLKILLAWCNPLAFCNLKDLVVDIWVVVVSMVIVYCLGWVVESYWSLWETATIIRCSHLLIFSLGNIFCVGNSNSVFLSFSYTSINLVFKIAEIDRLLLITKTPSLDVAYTSSTIYHAAKEFHTWNTSLLLEIFLLPCPEITQSPLYKKIT